MVTLNIEERVDLEDRKVISKGIWRTTYQKPERERVIKSVER